MRILFWSGTFWPNIGGVEVLAAKLLPALQERGYELAVVTPQRNLDLSAKVQYKGIPVYRFSFTFEQNSIDQLMEMRQQISNLKRAFAPDLVHINAVSATNFFHLITASAHPAPLLLTLHDERLRDDNQSELPVGGDRLMGKLLRAADWISCVSAAVLMEVSRPVPEIVSRSSVIHNGLDLPFLLPSPLPTHPLRLLCLGRLVVRKGFDVALSAFALISRRFPEVRLVIAGDGPARPALEKQAADLRIATLVDFVSWVAPEDVPALMNTATLVVMPSRREPFGLVALEAAQMARPIVATRVGGLPEVVAHGQTGLLVENENVAELAEAVTLLLEHPEVAIRMGQAARHRAIASFGWDRCIDAYDTLYRKLVEESHTSKRRTGNP
jgi:glycogen(starch) synthase